MQLHFLVDKKEILFLILQNKTMFTEEQIEAVWQKASIMPNNDPNVFRQDYAGAWIKRDQYDRSDTKYGWTINFNKPIKDGGTEELSNCYPLHWRNAQAKGDNYPSWTLVLSSEENKNIEKVTSWNTK